MELNALVSLVQVLCGVLGVFLVSREVYRGYVMEKDAEDHPFLKHAQFLYAIQDYRAFYIASRLDQGDSPQRAREFVDFLCSDSEGDERIRDAVEEMWGISATRLAESLKHHDHLGRPAARAKRKRDLLIGAALLIASTILGAFT